MWLRWKARNIWNRTRAGAAVTGDDPPPPGLTGSRPVHYSSVGLARGPDANIYQGDMQSTHQITSVCYYHYKAHLPFCNFKSRELFKLLSTFMELHKLNWFNPRCKKLCRSCFYSEHIRWSSNWLTTLTKCALNILSKANSIICDIIQENEKNATKDTTNFFLLFQRLH